MKKIYMNFLGYKAINISMETLIMILSWTSKQINLRVTHLSLFQHTLVKN